MLNTLTASQVDDLIDAAAGFISVLDELRPLDPKTYNPCYQVWRVISAIPAPDRPRLLHELEPGSLRTLWKASMARYVLNGERASEMFEGHSVWDDFPLRPGEVGGLCDGALKQLQQQQQRWRWRQQWWQWRQTIASTAARDAVVAVEGEHCKICVVWQRAT